jgi:predicted metal-dependent enzyme (double-stranded beta helix superfamily)
MTVMPHNHSICGRSLGSTPDARTTFSGRVCPTAQGKAEAAGAQALCAREVVSLGRDIIHSVTNPIPRLTGAIHVYGGDFFDPMHRSEWDPKSLQEKPFDPERATRRFEEANAIFAPKQ